WPPLPIQPISTIELAAVPRTDSALTKFNVEAADAATAPLTTVLRETRSCFFISLLGKINHEETKSTKVFSDLLRVLRFFVVDFHSFWGSPANTATPPVHF